MSSSESDELEGKSFEQLLVMLDEAVNALEANSLSLEDSLAEYEKSVQIVAACNDLLDKAELKVSQLDAKYLQLEQDAEDTGELESEIW